MAGGLTLDSGALIAAEKDDRRFWAIWARALDRQATITVPVAVLAQVWRGKNAVIGQMLRACNVADMDEETAKRAGELLAASGTSDVIDAVVVMVALRRRDTIITSDPGDIGRLLDAKRRRVPVVKI